MKKVPFLLAAVLAVSSARTALPTPRVLDQVLPAHPTRLIVKFRSSVTTCARCLVAEGLPFKSATGRDSLDRLNRSFGVREAHPLFLRDHELDADRKTTYRQRIDVVLGKYPARSARIPKGAAVPDLSNVYVLELPAGTDVAAAAARYAADPEVVYAQPDYVVQTTFTPNDPYFSSSGTWGQGYGDLWGLHASNADQGWDLAHGSGTVVAVIDTGVDPNHPDLAANIWSNPGEIPGNGIDDDGNGFIDDVAGWDFVQDDANPMDLHGHGTHVAGTAAAVGSNNVGVVGMAWGAKIMPVRGLDANGSGFTSDLAQAIEYAAENGADVLNNSWGGFGISQVLVDAVAMANGLGAVVVAAAGNSAASVDNFEPAGIEGVIAVGAISPNGQIASFSNHGNALSVAAPGVDVLSTRSSVSPVDQFGARVGQSYLRLSGTSMASPHAAGLSALILSGLPGLTPEEVRWQLELNATQPGYPGYVGQPWNPYFGWGQIDASHVLDPVPVTTRFRTHQIDLHGFVGETRPSAAAADFAFTSNGSVPWTLASPSWLVPDSTSGTTSAKVPITLDTTGLPVGGLSGSVDLSAPSAVDGGGSIPAALQVHSDQRVGGEIMVVQDFGYLESGPRVIQSSLGSLVFWSGGQGLQSARIDDTGTVTGPFQLADSYPLAYSVSVAADGQNFLVAWVAWTEVDIGRRFANYYDVKVMRIGPDGQPLGAAVTVESKKLPDRRGLYGVRVGFDGSGYTVLWGDVNVFTDRSKIYALRVLQNGLPAGRKTRIYPARGGKFPQFVEPDIACITGECLVVWQEADGETSSVGKYIDKIAGIRLAGTTVMDAPPLHLLRDADELVRVATDGSGYLVLVDRINLCAGPVLCGYDAIAARVAGGTSLDPDGIRLNTNLAPLNYLAPTDVAFDGTDWVVPFLAVTSPEGTPVVSFVARLSPNGTVVDSETPGLLLSATGTAGPAAIADTGTSSIVVYLDSRFDDLSDGYLTYRSLFAQRVLPHP